jgi:hypothetical protein
MKRSRLILRSLVVPAISWRLTLWTRRVLGADGTACIQKRRIFPLPV